MTDFSTLWDHAGDSAEREAADRAMHHAVAQVTPVSEFLFQASDEHDLENRIALASDRFTKAAVQHGVDEEALVTRFRNEASLVLEAKEAAREPKAPTVSQSADPQSWCNHFKAMDEHYQTAKDTPLHHDLRCPIHGSDPHQRTASRKQAIRMPQDGEEVTHEAEGIPFHVTYHSEQAMGDNGSPARGYHTGTYTVTGPDGKSRYFRHTPNGPGLSGAQSAAAEDARRHMMDAWSKAKLNRLFNQAAKSDAHLANVKRALEEGQNPLEWLPAEDGGEGQAEDPSISGNEAFLEGDYVGGSNQQSTASRKTASDEHYRHGYSHGHSDHMRRLRNERLFGMTYRSDHEANPYEYGSDMHSGYANGRRDAMDGKPAQHQSPYDDGTWSDDDSDWGHDDSDPSLRMANRRKAARSLQAGDVISARATFHGEPLRREAVVAQVAQDAIEPGWVRINTQDGRVLRTPKIASVVLDPKA